MLLVNNLYKFGIIIYFNTTLKGQHKILDDDYNHMGPITFVKIIYYIF